jgi:hypothetical protein
MAYDMRECFDKAVLAERNNIGGGRTETALADLENVILSGAKAVKTQYKFNQSKLKELIYHGNSIIIQISIIGPSNQPDRISR